MPDPPPFGVPSNNPASPFYDDPLFGHPWMSRAEAEARRQYRHRLWSARLTARDRARILELARQVSPAFCPARLEDLDARGLAVGVAPAGCKWRCGSGEQIATVLEGTVAVLVWLL